jgi:hypothetical protein
MRRVCGCPFNSYENLKTIGNSRCITARLGIIF